jgi:hypothetical protein
VVEEFLDDNGCSYEPIDVAAADDRWRSFGTPALPALVVGGVARAVSHPVQVATLLDLPVAAVEDLLRIGFDLDRILAVWVEAIVLAPLEALLEPTPSRGRTGLELAVNVFVPADLLSSAFATGTFAWPGHLSTALFRTARRAAAARRAAPRTGDDVPRRHRPRDPRAPRRGPRRPAAGADLLI